VPTGELPLSSPVSLRKVLSFGVLFLLISAIGTVGARFLGKYGFLIVSLFGSSAAPARRRPPANLSVHGRLSPSAAAVGTILASVATVMVNLPVPYRQTGRKEETRTLSVFSFVLVLIGLAVLLVREQVWQHLP
jgi:uncharacterized membrane protein (DUF4010 family)